MINASVYGVPIRLLNGQKVYYIEDMPESIRIDFIEYCSIVKGLRGMKHVSFKTYHEWVERVES